MEDTFVMLYKVNLETEAQFVLVFVLLTWVSGQWKTLIVLISQSCSASIPYEFFIQFFILFYVNDFTGSYCSHNFLKMLAQIGRGYYDADPLYWFVTFISFFLTNDNIDVELIY